jgi:hypothetical protein
MKKKLEQELISIAHRVLKLTGKEDLPQLYVESKNLYEKIAILHFYENHYQSLAEEIPAEKLAEKLESFTNELAQNVATQPLEEVVIKEEIISEEIIEKEEVIQESVLAEGSVAEGVEETLEIINEEKVIFEAPVEEVIAEETSEIISEEATETIVSEEENLEETPTLFEPIADEAIEEAKPTLHEIIGEGFQDLEFIKVETKKQETLTKTTEIISENQETKKEITSVVTETIQQKIAKPAASLNDVLNKGITFGLNDRIAFVKHLFAGSNEDFNRVVSQLNTFETHEEALQFIEDLVKPDYDHWAGKDEYAQRFLQIVEKNFL